MNPIERRDFIKGAATGALAFTVGGVETLLTPREARAQNVPFRLLKANEAETIEALGETLVPGARAAGVAHFIDQQLSVPPGEALLEARILNVRPPYAAFIARQSAPSIRRVRRSTAAVISRSSIRASGTTLSTRCDRTSCRTGKGPADRWFIWYCAATLSTSSTGPSKATMPSGSRTCRISRHSRGGDDGDQ